MNCTETTKLKLNHTSQTSKIRIAKGGVRQGCILLSLLFNVEKISQLALQNHTGIKVNGIPINNLRYADDTAIVQNIQKLGIILHAINEVEKECNLNINVSKIKLMISQPLILR